MFTRILIPLDGSTIAETVLPYARSLAESMKIPLEFLGVVDISATAENIVADKARYLQTVILAGERSMEKYLRGVADRTGIVEGGYRIVHGKPAEIIVAQAGKNRNTLIAMASHGRTGLNRWLLGSVAEKVLRSTRNPLFLVRTGDAAAAQAGLSLKSVIVPLDGSTLAESVLPAAAALAESFKLEVILFRAYELPAAAYYGKEDHLPDYGEMTKKVRAAAEEYLESKVHALKTRGLTQVRPLVAEGPGAREIIRCARRHADSMIAMCSHGRSGVKGWLIGSVTEKVVRHSKNPVLVVRGASPLL